jgi:two-component system copper resistance phosphate regulon response regulator CusR
MRILLVEDQPDAARMIAKGFREESYAVDVADDGETGWFKADGRLINGLKGEVKP